MAVDFTAIKPDTYISKVFIPQNLKCMGCPYNFEEGALCRNPLKTCIRDLKVDCCGGYA